MANKVYELVTEQIIHQLETAIQQGSPAPWCKPWNCNTVPINHISGKQYNGINLLLLPDCDEYLTWAQLCDLQKHRPELKLKKGSKSHIVVYFSFKESEKDTVTTDGQLEKERVQIPFLRYYRVFSIGDVEGGLQPKRKVSHYEHDPIEEADKVCNDYINREGITLHFADADRAFYNPLCDMGVSRAYAYKVIKQLNDELESKGYMVVNGRTSRKYFNERFYGKVLSA